MARRPSKKKTYSEFMAWLEGVECMQPSDWHPSPEQWKIIREMIGKLKPEVVEVEVDAPQSTPATPQQPTENVARFIESTPQNVPTALPVAPPQYPKPSGVVGDLPSETEVPTENGKYESEFV